MRKCGFAGKLKADVNSVRISKRVAKGGKLEGMGSEPPLLIETYNILAWEAASSFNSLTIVTTRYKCKQIIVHRKLVLDCFTRAMHYVRRAVIATVSRPSVRLCVCPSVRL